jgi:GNAT superfamily N-acetyltransferase
MAYEIRRAGPDDAERLSVLANHTFTETFGHLYSAQDLKTHLQASYNAPLLRQLLADPDHQWLVAEKDGEMVAHAHGGPCGLPHPEAAKDHGELKRLYVRQTIHNSGLGTRLLNQTLDFLTDHFPGKPQWVGVWEENPGARRLYERHGFEEVGAYDFTVGEHLDEDLILRRPAPVARA